MSSILEQHLFIIAYHCKYIAKRYYCYEEIFLLLLLYITYSYN
jgi:hypothetical protein